MSVRARLTVTVALVTAVLIAAGTVVFAVQLRSRLVAQTDASLRSRSEVLVALVQREGTSPDLPRSTDDGDQRHIAQIVAPDGTVVSSDGIAKPLATADVIDRAERSPVYFDTSLDPNGDREMRALATPVATTSGTSALVVVAETSKPVQDLLVDILLAALVAAVVAIAAASAGAWFVAGAALSPVEHLRRQAARLSATDTDSRLDEPPTGDELTQLAVTLNDLLDRLHATLRRERQLVADTAHELRTPLAELTTELELAERPGRHSDELRAAITRARHDAARLSRLAGGLLFLARTDEGAAPLNLVDQPIAETVERAVKRHDRATSPSSATLGFASHGDTLIRHDPDRIDQIIDNLVTNTLDHATGTTRLTIHVDGTTPHHVTITVDDDGPGFPAALLPHVFERFRRGDHARTSPGTGLGLSIVHAIVDMHQGTIHANNQHPNGARITIHLPRNPQTSQAGDPTREPSNRRLASALGDTIATRRQTTDRS